MSKDELKILHESQDFLVVDKPPDLIINSDDADRDSLYRRLAAARPHLADFERFKHGFRVLHRLDHATSGVLAVPMSDRANRLGQRALQSRTAGKYYLALVRGHLAPARLTTRAAVGDDRRPEWAGLRMAADAHEFCRRAKPAETRLVVLSRGRFQGRPASKVLLKPLTGRRHQLRVHCHELGHTIVGDFIYSDRKDNATSRMYLHALKLNLPLDNSESLEVCTDDPFRGDLDYVEETVTDIGLKFLSEKHFDSFFDDIEPS